MELSVRNRGLVLVAAMALAAATIVWMVVAALPPTSTFLRPHIRQPQVALQRGMPPVHWADPWGSTTGGELWGPKVEPPAKASQHLSTAGSPLHPSGVVLSAANNGGKSSIAPWQQHLPNALSILRCVAIPVLMVFFFWQPYRPCLVTGLFIATSLTDLLDGYLARRWDVTSAFGAFLDPVADKLMVAAVLILLAGRFGAVVAGPAAVILVREIAISALREWMAEQGLRNVVKVGFAGKVKTTLQMVAIALLLLLPHPAPSGAPLFKAGMAALALATILTVSSGMSYFQAAWPSLMAHSQ